MLIRKYESKGDEIVLRGKFSFVKFKELVLLEFTY